MCMSVKQLHHHPDPLPHSYGNFNDLAMPLPHIETMESQHTSAALAILRCCSSASPSSEAARTSKLAEEHATSCTSSAPAFRMTDPVSASRVSTSSMRKVASDPVLQGKPAVQPMHGSLDSVLFKMAAASAAMKLPPRSNLAPASPPFVGASNAPVQPLLMSLLTGGAGNGHLASAPSNDSSTSSSNQCSSKNMPNSLYKVRPILCCHPVQIDQLPRLPRHLVSQACRLLGDVQETYQGATNWQTCGHPHSTLHESNDGNELVWFMSSR